MNQPFPEADDRQAREPAFNIAAIVIAFMGVCVATHVVRIYFLTGHADFELLIRAAFIPARYTAAPLDIYAFLSPFTYSLLHGDFLHLAVNMIWLAAFGSPLANRIGAIRFAGFWMFTAGGAVALHYVLHSGDPVPVIGASGAISGMMAAASRFGFSVDRSAHRSAFAGPRLPLREMLRRRTVIVFLSVWMIVNLIAGLGWLTPGEGPPIAWEAHVGGFVAGLAGIYLFDRKRPGQPS